MAWEEDDQKRPYLISISLNVVSIALVFCASFNRCAILCLILFILTYKTENSSKLPKTNQFRSVE